MTSPNTLETLQTDVNQITAELAEVRKLEDEALKKSKAEAAALKAETLLNQVITAKEAATQKLETLKGKTDVTSVAEISRLETEIASLETMYQTLNSSKADLAVLKEGVASYIVDEEVKTEVAEGDAEPKTEEEKKGWLKKQIDGLSDSTEENHALKNTGRIVGGIGILAVGIRGIKKLFNRGKKKVEEKKDGSSSTTEKKGFWKNLLIGLGVGTGGYYLVHGLVTGRWEISDVLNWDKKNKENVRDLNERYKNEVPEALKPKYEKFGGMVDGYNDKIGSGNSLGTLEDEEGKEVTIPKGCIPAALDNAYDNVGDMLDPSNTINEQRADTGGQLRDWIKGVGRDAAGALLKPFVGAVKGLKKAMFGDDGKPNEEFDLRAKGDNLDRDAQIANLMQKYAMVTNYLTTKKEGLEREYARQYLVGMNNANPTEEQIVDACDNDDKAIEYIGAKMDAEFYNRKIISEKDEESIIPTLEKNNIYNVEPSPSDLKIAAEVAERKKEIVTDPLLFEKCKASPDINKDGTLKAELLATSERFEEYLDEGIIQRNMLESMANCFGLNLDELRNGKAADIENIIESLGFNEEVAIFKQQTIDFKIKLVDGTATKKDIEDFEKTIDAYFSKETDVLIKAKNKNNAEGGFWNNVRYWGKERIYKLTHTGGGIAILLGGAAFGALYVKSPGFRKIVAIPANMVKHAIGSRTRVPKILGINFHWKLGTYGKEPKNFGLLIDDFKLGKIDADIAQSVFNRRASGWGKTTTFTNEISSNLHLSIEKTDILLRYTQNRNVRKLLKDGKYVELVTELENFEKQVSLLSGNKKALLENMIVKGDFKSIDDIRNISKNIKNMDDALLSKLTTRGIKKLAKDLAKDMSVFTDVSKLNAKISGLNKSVISASADVLKAQDDIIKTIAKESDELKVTLKNSNIFIDDPITMVDNYYKAQIDNLEKFKIQVKSFTEVETKAFKQLQTLKFKSTHISELFTLGELDKEIKAVLTKGDDIDELIRVLIKQEKSVEKVGGRVSKELLEGLEELRLAKNLAEAGDEIFLTIKAAFKFVKGMKSVI